MSETYRTDWRNIGLWLDFGIMPSVGIQTPWGNLIVKKWSDRLFSERYGHQRTLRVGALCVSWVRLRHFHPL